MNISSHSNKRASERINRLTTHASFIEGDHAGTSYTKKRSLSDGCIDLPLQKTTVTTDSSSIISITALSNPELATTTKESMSRFTPTVNTKNCIYGITRLTNDDNAPIPLSFIQDASPHDDTSEKKSKLNRDEVCIDMPECIGESRDAPLPSPLYEIGERLDDLITSDKLKIKNSDNIHTREQDSLAGKSDRISNVTNVSMCSSSKDRLTVKSSNSELAVARPVTETDTIYEAVHYEPSSKQPIYKSTKCRIYTFIVLAAVIVLVTLTVYYTTKPFVPCCDFNETLVHTMKPITKREARIRQMIEDNVLERNATFNEMKVTDPRYLALDWIVNEDRLQLTVTDSNLLQRYTLALLAYSFDLISWECGMVKDLDSCNITDDYDDYALWLSRTDECPWYGVECDDSGVVTGLDLSSNNLIGTIPPEISGLTSLGKYLTMVVRSHHCCQELSLSLTFVASFMLSFPIDYLALGDNCIHGTLPSELFKLVNLRDIDVSLNYLSGVVPEQLYNVRALTKLDFFGNTFEGLCNRTDKDPLSITSKGLAGNILGSGIGKLNRLKELYVESNNFSGTISSDIGRLKNLVKLRAGDNNFSGAIPGSITKLQNLREVKLHE
ncbi:hypothetical protein ACHAXN_011630 [Cyclotella atomus]